MKNHVKLGGILRKFSLANESLELIFNQLRYTIYEILPKKKINERLYA